MTVEREDRPRLESVGLSKAGLHALPWNTALWDVGAAVIWGVWATLAVLLHSPVSLRVILGVPFVLFVPGYALVAALLPAKEPLDGVERVALSLGLSLAITPLLALVIHYSPWDLSVDPVVLSLLGSTVLFSAIAGRRRTNVLPGRRFVPELPRISIPPLSNWGGTTRLAVILAVASLVLLGGTAGVILAQRAGSGRTTEFALYNAQGQPGHYERDLAPGQTATEVVEVTNREDRNMRYRLQVVAGGRAVGQERTFSVPAGATRRQPITLRGPFPTQPSPVTFELYRADQSEGAKPYRTLRLFVNEGPSTPAGG